MWRCRSCSRMVSANIVNAVGDWALIYGHLGLPAMGITGSGWSTCVARIYMAGVLAVTLFWVESKRSLPKWRARFASICGGLQPC